MIFISHDTLALSVKTTATLRCKRVNSLALMNSYIEKNKGDKQQWK